MSQPITPSEVTAGANGKSPAGMPGPGIEALKHRRMKHSARAQIMRELTGSPTGGPGYIARALRAIGQALDSGDPKLGLDAADRVIRLLPYILEKEGEAGESAGNALAAALRGHGGPIQIVFGQHFHGRDGQAVTSPGQALPGEAGANAGAGPISPASQP